MFNNMQSIKHIDGFLLKETDKQQLINAVRGIVLRNRKNILTAPLQITVHWNSVKRYCSQREKEIIGLIAKEFTTDEIAVEIKYQ